MRTVLWISFDLLLLLGESFSFQFAVRSAYMRSVRLVADSSPSLVFCFCRQYAYNPNRRASATPVQRSHPDANAYQQQQQQQHQVVQLPPLPPRNPSRLGHHPTSMPMPSRSQAPSRMSNQATAGGGASIRAMTTPAIQHRPTSVVQSHRSEFLRSLVSPFSPSAFYAYRIFPFFVACRLFLHPSSTSIPSSNPSTSKPKPPSSSRHSSSLDSCSNALLPQRSWKR